MLASLVPPHHGLLGDALNRDGCLYFRSELFQSQQRVESKNREIRHLQTQLDKAAERIARLEPKSSAQATAQAKGV